MSEAGARIACALSVLLLVPAALGAQTDDSDASTTVSLRTSIKASALAFRAPDAPDLYPERSGAESLLRLRVEPVVRTRGGAVFTLAYEQRARHTAGAAGLVTAGVLPAQTAAPFRIRPLDWSLAASDSASWRHEIDRASVQLHAGRADVSIGRQAVGWGRGVMFGAVDLFTPFSPLEADREWRRGVDAVRTDIKLTDRSSVDVVGAFGPAWDRSAVAVRVRGYAKALDLEIVGGRRARDVFGGLSTSAAVGDAEVHGEIAVFGVPAGTAPSGDTVWKGVAGASYRLPIGSGILTFVEYHYSGFGAARPGDILTLLSSPSFTERYVRGDMQILGRHAVAVTASYEASPEWSYSAQWIGSPRDGSGVIAPGTTYTFSDRLSLLGNGYLPYGRTPLGRVLRSEYGSASFSALLQLRAYF